LFSASFTGENIPMNVFVSRVFLFVAELFLRNVSGVSCLWSIDFGRRGFVRSQEVYYVGRWSATESSSLCLVPWAGSRSVFSVFRDAAGRATFPGRLGQESAGRIGGASGRGAQRSTRSTFAGLSCWSPPGESGCLRGAMGAGPGKLCRV